MNKHWLMCRLAAAWLAFAMLLAPASALCESSEEPAPSTPEMVASLEDELPRLFDFYDVMGGCVAVFQNGEVTYVYTWGERQRGGDPVTPECAFQVGSISKMVANIGLMQLLETQNIPLDTDISQILGYTVRHPEYPDEPITLRQVMTHTAALADSSYYDVALSGKPRPLQAMLTGPIAEANFLKGQKPGQKSVYSNFGGGLIACFIEKLSGQTLDDYMTEHVFAPLGITASYQPARMPESIPLCDMYQMPARRLTKALREDPTHITEPDPEHHYFLTAGKLVISAPDLCKLLIALCDGGVYGDVRLLKESTAREILTLQNDLGSVFCDSGRGLFLNIIEDNQVAGRTMYGHGGKANGMLCAAYFDPTDRTGVVMLTNGCRNEPVRYGVGMLGYRTLTAVYELWLDQEHQEIDAFTVQ